jgi:hypothetical protein
VELHFSCNAEAAETVAPSALLNDWQKICSFLPEPALNGEQKTLTGTLATKKSRRFSPVPRVNGEKITRRFIFPRYFGVMSG